MLLENKYTNTYRKLIDRAKQRGFPEGYYEKHHILPKSIGGNDNEDNLVALTAKEHYIAHLLLTKMVDDKQHLIKMAWALHRMTFSTMNSRAYDFNRNKWSKWMIEIFHPYRNSCPKYKEKLSQSIENSWKNDNKRRNKFSKFMASKQAEWRKNPGYNEEQKRRAKIGAQKSKEIISNRLEYKGSIYLGYKDLMEATGCSKHLYKKFYKNGIDPSFRIGKDGPMSLIDIKKVIKKYCYATNTQIPLTKKDAEKLLLKIKKLGILTNNQIILYLKKF